MGELHLSRYKQKSTTESVLNPSSEDHELMEKTRKVEGLDGNDNLIKEPHTGNLKTGDGRPLWMQFF